MVVLAGYDERAGGQPLQGAVRLCATFAEVLALRPRPVAIAIDMPIGLLERAEPGGRACDRAARAALGRGRASSVFSPPARPALANQGYADAMRRNGAGLSKQAYNILPRIREVDEVMTPTLQRCVFETHPELVFARLAGCPLRHPKRTPAGVRERLACLRPVWGPALPRAAPVRAELGRAAVALDDVLDACALAHAAWCIRRGEARRFPAAPQRDARGLRMEVWG
jgi:predicted RNase H-like nuclease